MKVGIIGGGPAGYAAAIRAAQLGAEVVVFERDRPGGVCLNRGCVPTKNLLAWARAYREARAEGFVSGPPPSIGPALEKARAGAERFSHAVSKLLASYGIDVISGDAALVEPFVVEANGETCRFDRVIIATGSKPSLPPLFAEVRALTGEDFSLIPEEPGNVVIVGGGVQGVEYASFFAMLGYPVTLVEMEEHILPFLPSGVANAYAMRLKRRGVFIRSATTVLSVRSQKGTYELVLADGSRIEADTLMVVTGRVPATSAVRIDGLLDDRGFVIVDDTLETPLKGHFAAGDCVRSFGLAYTAYAEGRIAAENAVRASGAPERRRFVVPQVVFGEPEIAWVGDIEGDGLREVKVPAGLSAKASAEHEDDGFVSLFFREGSEWETGDAIDGEGAGGRNRSDGSPSPDLVGGVIVGGPAGELIHVISALVAQADEEALFVHPTFAELIGEGLDAARGHPRHLQIRKGGRA